LSSNVTKILSPWAATGRVRDIIKIEMKAKTNIIFFTIANIILLSLVGFFYYKKNTKLINLPSEEAQTETAEITAIKTSTEFSKQTQAYTELIERVGAIEAQDLLVKSGMPFDGQSHLINHTVGDWIYKKYGKDGLPYCRDYFLSSCHHGFIIRAVSEEGRSVLIDIMKSCWDSGTTVATQCAHGIGHGVLAWVGYANLDKALVECDEVAKKSPNFPLFNCHDGVFMENLWAVHDGNVSEDQWLRDDDLNYPCNDKRIDKKYWGACWANQPSRMYQMMGGDFAAVGRECLKLTDSNLKSICFNAIARQIHPTTQGSIDKTFELCNQMPLGWQEECIYSVAKSAFSVGDRERPFEMCKRMPEGVNAVCFSNLSFIISVYAQNSEQKNEWCGKMNEERFVNQCVGNSMPE
jgi:hypothetical protein